MTVSFSLWTLTLSVLSLHLQLHTAAAGGSYAPTTDAPCPDPSSQPLVRSFSSEQSTNPQEQAYIHALEANTLPDAWKNWLGDASEIGYTFSDFPAGSFPRIGIGVGGGGYRGALYGAGVLNALDGRNSSAKKSGTGGLLQVASYIAGSSGGSWVTASMLMNDWPTTSNLVYGGGGLNGWMLEQDLFDPSDGGGQNQQYYQAVMDSVKSKAATGLPTSIVDPWGRLLAYHFLNGTTSKNMYDDSAHGAGQLWSAIPQSPAFQQYAVPFPLIVSDSLHENQNVSGVLPLDNVVYEFSPYEFGSWDPNLAAMVYVAYVGTHLSDGSAANGKCTMGFDQASFIIGASANNFSGNLNNGGVDGFSSSDQQVLLSQLNDPSNSPNNAAANVPNPFQSVSSSTFSESGSNYLGLVDGGANGEHVPFGSLLVKSRFVDVVVALDAGADIVNDWPNGTSLLQTSNRVKNVLSTSHQQFPQIPSSSGDFINYGMNMRPTFFGCNPAHNPPESPLVIYLPNSPPVDGTQPYTNPSSSIFNYTDDLTSAFMNQAYANAVGGFMPNKTGADPDWGLCLRCAAIDRARYKAASSATPSPTSSSSSQTKGLLSATSSFSSSTSQATDTIPSTTQVLLPSSSTFVSSSLSESYLDQETSLLSSATTSISEDAQPTLSASADRFAGSRRAQATSTPQRSEICQKCFQQYCYNPNAPPPPSSVPGRQTVFEQPLPLGGIPQVEYWVKTHKAELAGIVLGVVAFIGGAIGGISILAEEAREETTVLPGG
ncbi:FabD lysophospholipase-like protein [Coniophora puteana RWD-64-598 SS2]|uniref:Lysophospholipase n=1 Tax=Coniophora puteana (strain RWD-64-598) TaxID=741705 RepID=A0A5M3MVU0_CONPW|nr:FabD lysophospholipase-like protein [Coniophora puteana RWD-64-598 SS2]EIW83246.1 FabD lysophospholipase-like protein [Coniophora puteana RWD-64-598 SS2]